MEREFIGKGRKLYLQIKLIKSKPHCLIDNLKGCSPLLEHRTNR
jgi:hypothetical protein